MKLTREDLAMMLDEMNNYGADYIYVSSSIDMDMNKLECELESISFNAIKKNIFIKNLLTLKP